VIKVSPPEAVTHSLGLNISHFSVQNGLHVAIARWIRRSPHVSWSRLAHVPIKEEALLL